MGRRNDPGLPALPPVLRKMTEEHRLVHGVNLEGEPGSGRTRMALALAGAVLCEKQQGEMCGECLPCRKVLAGAHSDVTVVNGRENPELFKVDALRQLCAGAYRSPNEGRAKVYIIAEAQLLLAAGQNVLLKSIEEPPEDTFFILTCDNKFRLLPTVLSRVVTVALPPPPPEQYQKADAARSLLEAMAAKDPYKVIAAATPFEKDRSGYAVLLDSAARLCALPELRQQLGLSPAQAALIRKKLDRAAEQNRQNGYLPLLTALLASGRRR